MANLGKIVYGRRFQEEEIMQEYHGENSEDVKIGEEMIKKFALDSIRNNIYFGSDGTFNYTFHPFGCPIIKENKGNNPNIYRKQYLIEKTGNRKDKRKLADIEEFLLFEKGFIEMKK